MNTADRRLQNGGDVVPHGIEVEAYIPEQEVQTHSGKMIGLYVGLTACAALALLGLKGSKEKNQDASNLQTPNPVEAYQTPSERQIAFYQELKAREEAQKKQLIAETE